jgi:toxin CptA
LSNFLAPAVAYPAGRSGFLSLVLYGLLLLGAAAVAFYGYYTYSPHKLLVWQLSLLGLMWLSSAFGVWQFIQHLPTGELHFDGATWYFESELGTASVRFDGQNCLLLCFQNELKRNGLPKMQWLWLEERFDPVHWHDLRRAVYSRAESHN